MNGFTVKVVLFEFFNRRPPAYRVNQWISVFFCGEGLGFCEKPAQGPLLSAKLKLDAETFIDTPVLG